MTSVRYVVRGTLASPSFLEDYLSWLQGGHVQDVIALGKALSAEVIVLDVVDGGSVMVETSYEFSDRAALEAYFAGPAIELRKDGVERWVETGKATFSRTIGEIKFRAG